MPGAAGGCVQGREGDVPSSPLEPRVLILELRLRGPRPAPSSAPPGPASSPSHTRKGCVSLQPKGDRRRETRMAGGREPVQERLEGCGGARMEQVLGRGRGKGARPELLPACTPSSCGTWRAPPSGASGPAGCRVGSRQGWKHRRLHRRGGEGAGEAPGQAWRWRESQPGKMEPGPGGGGTEEEDFGGNGEEGAEVESEEGAALTWARAAPARGARAGPGSRLHGRSRCRRPREQTLQQRGLTRRPCAGEGEAEGAGRGGGAWPGT